MLTFLKNHPFAVEAFFDTSLVLTYAVPKEELQPLLPSCLRLDTFENNWAFVAVAVVQTRGLRPKGFPAFTGSDFVLTGYRIFVRYTTSAGKTLRGLYILKSETDKARMARMGNVFTHYNYRQTDVQVAVNRQQISVVSKRSALDLAVSLDENAPLPAQSPFRNWKEARRFAGPLPFTFTVNRRNNEVLIIEGVRQAWSPKPVAVQQARVGFIEQLGLKNAVLANAFLVRNVPYYWKKGKRDTWKP